MLRIAICDDEKHFRLREKELIEKYMEEREYSFQIDLYVSGEELLSAPDSVLKYDVIFLDISMEELDGLKTAEAIRELSVDVCIVFVTAYITYVLEGYKVDAVRYLLKEDDSLESAIAECLNAIIKRIDYKKTMYELDFQNGKKKLPADSIVYVESRLHKVIFHVPEAEPTEYFRYDRLDAVEKELQKYGFCRVHQSFLVNMKYAKNVTRYILLLENGEEISISKKYYKSVETEYIRRQGGI